MSLLSKKILAAGLMVLGLTVSPVDGTVSVKTVDGVVMVFGFWVQSYILLTNLSLRRHTDSRFKS